MNGEAQEQEAQVIRLPRLIPGGEAPGPQELAVAGVLLGSLGLLWAFRKGFRGLPGVELSGSAARGVEFAAYLMVVGGTLRVLSIQFPNSNVAKAINFLY